MNPKGWIVKRKIDNIEVYLSFSGKYPITRIIYPTKFWSKDITKANVFRRKHHARVSSRPWEDSYIVPVYPCEITSLYEGYILLMKG